MKSTLARPGLALLGALAVIATLACSRDAAEARAASGTLESASPLPPGNGDGTAAPAPDSRASQPSETSTETQAATAPPAVTGFAPTTLRQEELRGVALQALQVGDTDLSIAALIALSETPEASDLRASGALLLAELYQGEERGERAVAILEALIDTSPPMAELEFVLGRTLGEMGRGEEAERHLRLAIELGPELLQSYLYLGSLLVSAERQDDAAEVYLRYERMLGELLQALAQTNLDTQQRLAIVDALSLANPDERITRALLELLGQNNIGANAAAVQTLAAVGTVEAIAPLEAFAQITPHPELATAALQAATIIRQRSP